MSPAPSYLRWECLPLPRLSALAAPGFTSPRPAGLSRPLDSEEGRREPGEGRREPEEKLEAGAGGDTVPSTPWSLK